MADTASQKVPERIKDIFTKGVSAYERGNLDYAVDLLFACVERAPQFLKGRAYLRSAEVKRFKMSRKGGIHHAMAMISNLPAYLKASALVNSGKGLQAVEIAEKLLRADPLHPKFINVFARAAMSAGMPDVAIQTLQVASDHYPKDVNVLNMLGSLYSEIGQTRNARSCFEKVCEMRPHDPEALKALKDAMALDSMSSDGWSEAAKKGGTYRELIRDTKEAEILEQEAKAVKTEKDVDALVQDTLQKIEQEPENMNYYRALARLYTQKGDYDEALNTITVAQERSPGDTEIDAMKSSIRLRQIGEEIKRLKEAGEEQAAQAKEEERAAFVFQDLQERVQRYPNDMNLRFEWGRVLFENGDLTQAIQQFQMAQRSPKHRRQAMYYLGMSLKKKKQYDLALEQLEKVAKENPGMDETQKDICYEIGQIAEELGDLEKAGLYYKQIYQVDIGYRDISDKIEKLYSQGG